MSGELEPRPDLQKPMVHLNGTGRESLVEQYCDAGAAISKAIRALEAAYPNGRDYYTLGSEALKRATGEHNERIAALVRVREEMEALAEYVADYA